jgi:nucleotidyltransferase substrate binding protein (TIGR01987 family)
MDLKNIQLQKALRTIEKLVDYDFSNLYSQLDEEIIDSIKNGIAHKFEYCCELFWKAAKGYLLKVDGIDEASPKKVMKALFLTGYVDEGEYNALLSMIDDRNILSHVYSEEEFNAITKRIKDYVQIMNDISNKLIIPANEQ